MMLCLCFTLLIAAANAQSNPVETIKTGQIMGKRIDVMNKQADVFLGIPYAESFSGERRFALPVEKASWSGVYNATDYGHVCWQITGSVASDDCLNLNIWVPYPRPQNDAVLVWIHGGAYLTGSSAHPWYDGKYLATIEDIIVVSMNYRLGPFGFLATGDSSAPGNQGLYDQAMALHWVQDNIATFGGDPDRVTIFGTSAGGSSAALHMLSPVSRSLFQRAIIQSAGITSSWVYTTQDVALERAKLLAQSVGCLEDGDGEEQSIPDMINCLQGINANELVTAYPLITGFLDFTYTPVYDGIFLPEDPIDARDRGNFKQCELMIGGNLNEGSFYFVFRSVPGFSTDDESLLDNETYMKALSSTFPKLKDSFGLNAVAFQYRPWKTPDNQTLLRDAVDLAVGDYLFSCPSVEVAKAYAREGNQVYYYRFEERPSNSPFPEWMGVIHGDEIRYVFGIPFDGSYGYSSTEIALSRKLMEFWANFARNGNPNSDTSDMANSRYMWPQYEVETQEFLVLNETLAGTDPWVTGSGFKPQECAFWRHFLPDLLDQTVTKRPVSKKRKLRKQN